MPRNKSAVAVFFVCAFRLFTASLIKAEWKFIDTSFKNVPGSRRDELPAGLDYRLGAVSPVKDQGNCSACWAFSSIAAIESQWKMHTQQDVILSEQFLIDCNHMGAGCGATNLLKTYGDIASLLTGLLRVNEYRPYDPSDHPRYDCKWNGDTSLLTPVTGFRRVQPGNEVDMVTYLYHNGPLSAGINDAAMVDYDYNRHGPKIDRPTKYTCPNGLSDLNHAVLIVGYDVTTDENGEEVLYWIIKNSWGTSWGHQGYYYLERGTNACGIANDVVFPFVP